MTLVYLAVAALAGAMLPLQSAMNARLTRTVGSPIWAGAISGLVLTIAVAVVAAVASRGGPRLTGLAALPWWAWAGGLGGGVLLVTTAALAPKTGTATLIAFVIAGQVVCSLVMDNFGLLGLPVQPFGIKRAAAAILLLAGAALIRSK